MKRFLLICFVCCCVTATNIAAQGLTDMSRSKQAKMQNLPMGATKWTAGFWGDRFSMLSTTGIVIFCTFSKKSMFFSGFSTTSVT